MKRQISTVPYTVADVPVAPGDDVAAWLTNQAKGNGLRWLLAHADDGVIWGEVRSDGLHLSSGAFPGVSPRLRPKALQQARLFGEQSELHLWRSGEGWQARLVQEGAGEAGEYFDEAHLLWGDGEADAPQDGFVLLRQGAEGLLHAPPASGEVKFPLRLLVRHYVDYDDEGQAYVCLSRLVGLRA
jgi:CRISPR-associated protein (TIGR03984 family)